MRRYDVTFAIALAAAAGPASALTTVDTPSLVTNSHDLFHRIVGRPVCLVLNTGTKSVDGTLSFVNDAGGVAQSSPVAVPPGQVAVVPGPYVYSRGSCRLEGAFSKKSVRLTLCALPDSDPNPSPLDHEGCTGAVTSP